MKLHEATLQPTDLPEYLGRTSRPFHTGTFFIGQEQGRRAYIELRAKLLEVPEGFPLIIRIPINHLLDASYAGASLVILGKEMTEGKFGERGLILGGLNKDSLINLNAALCQRRVKIAFLTIDLLDRCGYTGQLAPYLEDTLKLVKRAGQLTVSELSKERQLRTNAASNRLNRLHRLRLVRREEVTTPNGLAHVYHFWQWTK
jgi:hypothetical protein